MSRHPVTAETGRPPHQSELTAASPVPRRRGGAVRLCRCTHPGPGPWGGAVAAPWGSGGPRGKPPVRRRNTRVPRRDHPNRRTCTSPRRSTRRRRGRNPADPVSRCGGWSSWSFRGLVGTGAAGWTGATGHREHRGCSGRSRHRARRSRCSRPPAAWTPRRSPSGPVHTRFRRWCRWRVSCPGTRRCR